MTWSLFGIGVIARFFFNAKMLAISWYSTFETCGLASSFAVNGDSYSDK
jgi:hypothetical protein